MCAMIKYLFHFSKSKPTEITKTVDSDKKALNQKELPIVEPTDLSEINDLYTAEQKDSRAKNILLSSLIALSALSIPAIEYADDYSPNAHSKVETKTVIDNSITCNPEIIAKGGEDDNIVEPEELINLLDFSHMQTISPDANTLVKTDIFSNLKPVDINSPDAKNKIVEQVQKAQAAIDHYSNKLAETPYVSFQEQQNAFNAKYITGDEFLDNVDFSELKRYQPDVTVLRALIRTNVPRIERNEAKVAEKYEKEVEKIQEFVNGITKKYELKSNIAGNDDFDEILSYDEFKSLLNTDCLHDLPKETKIKLLDNAMKNYHTIIIGDLKGKKDVKRKNQEIFIELQKIQNNLDANAYATQKAHFEKNNKY